MILGVSGLVGSEIVQQFKGEYEIHGISRKKIETETWNHIAFDLEKENITDVFMNVKPDIIISCTRGNYVEQLITHKKIAKYCSDNNSKLYYFSTANVFDSVPDSAKYEDDETCSESDYGKFKIKCEKLLKEELNDKVIIIRLPMVYGRKSLRLDEIKNSIDSGKPLEVYQNLYITSILDVELVRQLKYIIENDLKGIFHLASNDVINHAEFYRKLNNKNLHIKLNKIDNFDRYYLAIKTKREELKKFNFSNDDLISKLREYIV